MTAPSVDLPGSIPLFTRRGREIANYQDRDLQPHRAEQVVATHRKEYPFAEVRRPPVGQYNCHGLTFANRRTGIYGPADVETILKDDGYRKIKQANVEAGDLAVYYDGEEIAHTGLVLEMVEAESIGTFRLPRVVSKWGQAAEYIHMVKHGPYSENSITYWTDRP